jgi:hypothetical protein
MPTIVGKISAIISNSQMVINRGELDGVTKGMKFDIQLKIPEIIDPDDPTNILSSTYYTKGTLKVTTVFEKMSFADLESKMNLNIFLPDKPAVKPDYPPVEQNIFINDKDWVIKTGDSVISKS